MFFCLVVVFKLLSATFCSFSVHVFSSLGYVHFQNIIVSGIFLISLSDYSLLVIVQMSFLRVFGILKFCGIHLLVSRRNIFEGGILGAVTGERGLEYLSYVPQGLM